MNIAANRLLEMFAETNPKIFEPIGDLDWQSQMIAMLFSQNITATCIISSLLLMLMVVICPSNCPNGKLSKVLYCLAWAAIIICMLIALFVPDANNADLIYTIQKMIVGGME